MQTADDEYQCKCVTIIVCLDSVMPSLQENCFEMTKSMQPFSCCACDYIGDAFNILRVKKVTVLAISSELCFSKLSLAALILFQSGQCVVEFPGPVFWGLRDELVYVLEIGLVLMLWSVWCVWSCSSQALL